MIISFANNKGGTGKTTSCVNLATALAQTGKHVLLVDVDPQGSSTISFGFEKSKLLYTVYDVVAQSRKVDEVTLETRVKNLSLVPSNIDLAGGEVELSSIPGREFILRESLGVARHKYDVILIDCPPNIGILTVNAIVACDLMIVPVQCEYFSMEGLPTLLRFMRMVFPCRGRSGWLRRRVRVCLVWFGVRGIMLLTLTVSWRRRWQRQS